MNIRRRYQFKRGGFIFIAVTLLVSLGAFNSQNNLLFWAFGVGLSLLIVSGFVSGSMLMGVRIEREAAAPAAAGDPLTIRYAVTNKSKWMPAIALTVRERPATTHKDSTPAANPDRIVGPIIAFIPHLPRGKSIHARAVALTHKRGPIHLDTIEVVSSFPFGIFGKILTFSQPATALIHPARIELPRDLIRQVKGQSTRTTSAAASRKPGQGGHFHTLRDFTAGDPIRSISWRASARRDELVVVQTDAPQPNRIILLPRLEAWPTLNTNATDNNDDADLPIEQVIQVTASLAHALNEANTEVGLAIPTHNILIQPASGWRQHRLILDTLAALQQQPANNQQASTPPKATRGLAVVEITPDPIIHKPPTTLSPNAITIRADTIAARATKQRSSTTKAQPPHQRTSHRTTAKPSPVIAARQKAATNENTGGTA